jgi:hypothetical protein
MKFHPGAGYFQLIGLTLFSLLAFSSCSSNRRDAAAAASNSNQTTSGKPRPPVDQSDLSAAVVAAFREKYDVARFFAWDGSDLEGNVMWIDSQNQLWRGHYTRSGTVYEVYSAVDNPNDLNSERPRGKLVEPAKQAALAPYLSDAEFPVRLDTIDAGNFRAHIATVWLAKKRSFRSNAGTKTESHGPDPDIAWAGIRAVVTKNDDFSSNSIYEVSFSQPSPRKVLLEDVTGDGIKEYLYYERHMTEYLYIWSLSTSGVFQPLKFVADEASKPPEELDAMKICLESTDKGKIIIRSYNPPVGAIAPHVQEQITQETYQWNPAAGVFVRMSRVVGRKTEFYRNYTRKEEESWPGYTFSMNSCT